MPSPTQRLGFPTKDLGRNHVANGSTVTYAFCPPTSGDHYNVGGGIAPLVRTSDGFYPPTNTLRPGNWIHNLEHGYVVILYKGTPDQTTIDSIKTVLATAKGDAFAASCSQVNRVIAVRFDGMDAPFAMVAWDRALLLTAWDPVAAMTFANQWQDSPAAPESPAGGATGGIC